MAVGAVVARILTQYSDKGSKAAQKDIAKLGKSFDKFGRNAARAFGVATVASAAFAVKMGKDSVNAAIADQKSQILLANSLRNTTSATDGAIAGTEAYITQLQKQFSVVDDDLRPAFGRLAALTGSLSAAQSLLGTALDVSAQSGVDLATATGAIIKASSGQFKALKTLVPGLSAATIKSKDFGKALDEVSKATAGAAGKRAETLEFRLLGLRIAFGEIQETLGYAFLPILEKFATVITVKILPAVEKFVEENKKNLANSFAVATNAAVSFLTVAIAIGNWISNNMGIVKAMGILIAGMFVVGRISAFVIAIQSITAAMAILRTTALGAAVATALATGGVSIGTAVTALAAVGATGLVTKNLFDMARGNKGGTSKNTGTKTALDNIEKRGTVAPSIDFGDNGLKDFLAGLNKNTTATNKNTKALTPMDIATQNAIKFNQARQKALSGSSDLAIGGLGSRTYIPGVSVGGSSIGSTAMGAPTAVQTSMQARIDQLAALRSKIQKKINAQTPSIAAGGSVGTTSKSGGNNVSINVQGSVISNEDLLTNVRNGLQRTTKRQFGLPPIREYAFGR